MKKAARIVASLILAGAMSAVAMADNDFEFKGYARAGVLYNAELRASGSGPSVQNVGRLGNETSSPFFEAELVKNFKAGKSTGKYHVMLAQSTSQTDNNGTATWNTNNISVRQAFVEMTGLSIAPTATFWAGKRFYGRDDIHITDNYWRNISGTGAGVTGLLGGNLDLALVNGANPGSSDKDGTITNVSFDARYRISKVGPGNLEIEGTYSTLSGNEDKNGKAEGIVQGALVYKMASFFNITSGFSTVAVQAGTCKAGDLGNTEWNAWQPKDTTGVRVTAFGLSSVGDKWQIMPQVIYQKHDTDKGSAPSTLNMVVRPVYAVNDNVSVQFEGGIALLY